MQQDLAAESPTRYVGGKLYNRTCPEQVTLASNQCPRSKFKVPNDLHRGAVNPAASYFNRRLLGEARHCQCPLFSQTAWPPLIYSKTTDRPALVLIAINRPRVRWLASVRDASFRLSLTNLNTAWVFIQIACKLRHTEVKSPKHMPHHVIS
jgi:hypothetical protein